jgi:hypothetical protein
MHRKTDGFLGVGAAGADISVKRRGNISEQISRQFRPSRTVWNFISRTKFPGESMVVLMHPVFQF